MYRRQFMAGAAALALVGCSGSSSDGVTIASIIAEVKKQCAFAPELDGIVRIITTFVTGFNAEAGAATVIAAAIGKQIVDSICSAVKAQVAQMSVEKKSLPSKLVVIVNGVEVPGSYGATT
jgi:uncharacterized membrane-anchored protein YitT (DUF2179 family)